MRIENTLVKNERAVAASNGPAPETNPINTIDSIRRRKVAFAPKMGQQNPALETCIVAPVSYYDSTARRHRPAANLPLLLGKFKPYKTSTEWGEVGVRCPCGNTHRHTWRKGDYLAAHRLAHCRLDANSPVRESGYLVCGLPPNLEHLEGKWPFDLALMAAGEQMFDLVPTPTGPALVPLCIVCRKVLRSGSGVWILVVERNRETMEANRVALRCACRADACIDALVKLPMPHEKGGTVLDFEFRDFSSLWRENQTSEPERGGVR